MFYFGILRIFRENRKSAKTGKSWHYRAPTPQRREPMPRRRLRQGVGYLAEARLRCQNGTPRVRHDGVLLRCDVATVHSK